MSATEALLAAALALPAYVPPAPPIPAPPVEEAFLTIRDHGALAHPDFGLAAQRAKLERTSRGAGETFTFGIMGDVEPGRFWFQRMLPPGKRTFENQVADLQAQGPDMILQLGDFVSVGTPERFAAFLGQLERLVHVPFFPVTGNHDRDNPHGVVPHSMYREVFGPGDFTFDRGGYRFVLLDSSDGRVMHDQIEWLDRVLDTPKRTVIVTHIPPQYLKKRLDRPRKLPRVASASGDETPDDWYHLGYFKTGSEAFRAVVEKRRVERVYIGHIHSLASSQINGVKYVISGGSGSALYRFPGIPGEKIAHYILVTATPHGLIEEVRNLKGKRRELVYEERSLPPAAQAVASNNP